MQQNSNPTEYFSGLSNISYTPFANVTSGLSDINSKESKLNLNHVIAIWNYTNSSSNWKNYQFNMFYQDYLDNMDTSAQTIATIMHIYNKGGR